MLKSVKEVRAAIELLNPAAVRARAERPITIGLVAGTGGGYAELEDFLIPPGVRHAERMRLLEAVYRAGDESAPGSVDLVLYEDGLPCPDGAFAFHRDRPEATLAEILHAKDELALPLARFYPAFRKPAIERIVHAVAVENALFAVATALPNVVPSLLELPWTLGEFASDTAFLTVNQIRMAFLIAAASGSEVGFAHQKAEVLSIGCGAFGWRALARELAGKIPLGGGLIPKGAIAYAGTYVVGKGLQHYHHTRTPFTRAQRELAYQQAFERGKTVAESLSKGVSPNIR